MAASLNEFGGSLVGSPITTGISGPWDSASVAKQNGSFFPPITILGGRWNKLFPYRLLVVQQNNGNSWNIVNKGNSSPMTAGFNITGNSLGTFTDAANGGGPVGAIAYGLAAGISAAVQAVGKAVTPQQGFKLTFTPLNNQWAFTLPITPQQLQITTPYAISVVPTLTGIVEEHSGVRFKMINCSGTMGVLPYKNSIGENLTSSVGGFFSGTIAGANNIVTQFNSLKRAVGGSDGGVDVTSIPGGYAGTGYAQALLLDQFLEQYAEAKKNPDNSGWRLAFDIPKQNQTFIVTPVQFTWTQSIESPGEIKYSFQLKAWKRIDLASGAEEINPLPNVSPSILQRIVKTIATARSTVAAASATIQAVNGDVMQVANVITSVSLLVKEISGLPQTAADMSINLVKNLQSSIRQSTNTINSAFPFFNVTLPASTGSTVPVNSPIALYAGRSGSSPTVGSRSPADNLIAAVQAISLANAQNDGLSADAVASGQLGQAATAAAASSPSNQIFAQPYLYPEYFDAIKISSLNLTPAQQKNVNSYFATASLINIDDLLVAKTYLINLASLIANYYGKGNATYAYIYRTAPANVNNTPMTIDQFAVLDALYDLIQSINLLTATQQVDDGRIQNALGFEAQIATANGIPFLPATSKILAPVPYGLSIEQIAARYLGDPNRWVELAALNALQEPYIDESGFVLPLLSNATGRFFNVASGENLYIGQSVILMAAGLPSTTRHITAIDEVNTTNFLITVDGNDNLDIYTTAGSASMKAYLSGTVNSQGQIYVPTNDTALNDIRTRPVPAFANDNLVGLSKIDWLLSNGDIALDAYGDFRLAGGLTNLIQALLLKFAQPWAKNLLHPTYGAGLGYGTSTADFDAQAIYTQVATAVLSDPRFGSIVRLDITDKGTALNIDLAVTIANGNGILPINFDINV